MYNIFSTLVTFQALLVTVAQNWTGRCRQETVLVKKYFISSKIFTSWGNHTLCAASRASTRRPTAQVPSSSQLNQKKKTTSVSPGVTWSASASFYFEIGRDLKNLQIKARLDRTVAKPSRRKSKPRRHRLAWLPQVPDSREVTWSVDTPPPHINLRVASTLR